MSAAAASSRPPPNTSDVARDADSCRPLDDAIADIARKAIADLGLTEAARQTGIPKNTLAAGAGGARLRAGTRMFSADRLRRFAARGV
jgi:hypothetical protein